MSYNVNNFLMGKVQLANDLPALKDAILSIASSVVSDLQDIDIRREGGDKDLAGALAREKSRARQMEQRVSKLETKVEQLRRAARDSGAA